jgi:hypothetical protein
MYPAYTVKVEELSGFGVRQTYYRSNPLVPFFKIKLTSHFRAPFSLDYIFS